MADILSQEEIDRLLDICEDESISDYTIAIEKLIIENLDGVKNNTDLLKFFNNKNINGKVETCNIKLSLEEVFKVINNININKSLFSKNHEFLTSYSVCIIERETFQNHISELKEDKKILNVNIKKLEKEIEELKKKDLTINFE